VYLVPIISAKPKVSAESSSSESYWDYADIKSDPEYLSSESYKSSESYYYEYETSKSGEIEHREAAS